MSAPYAYRDSVLCCEDVPLPEVAALAGTPTFVYSGRHIDRAFRSVDEALSFAPHVVAYAMKANDNLAVLARLARLGSGADIVSGGELHRCLKAGIPPELIVFSGVGKQDWEIELALRERIRAIHVESTAEVTVAEELARRMGVRAPIALRVNPDVDPGTHPYIATGLHESKFGLELDVAAELLPRIMDSDSLDLTGVACHIGSQLTSPAPLRESVAIVARFARRCVDAGAPLRSLDAGGGWPLAYGDEEQAFPPWSAYGEGIRQGIEDAGASDLGLTVLAEPGRILVGDGGVLLTRVIFVKEQAGKRFVIIDAAMSELIRPALYEAHHEVEPVIEPAADVPREPADIVGPVCETGDFIALGRPLPEVSRGDLLAIRCAGAYGMTMASNYNSRTLPAEVMVDGDQARIVRDRQRMHDLWAGERT